MHTKSFFRYQNVRRVPAPHGHHDLPSCHHPWISQLLSNFKGQLSTDWPQSVAPLWIQKEVRSSTRKAHSLERTARSDEMIFALHAMIDEDSRVSMRRLAVSSEVDEVTVWRTVHEDFRYKSCRRKILQTLNTLTRLSFRLLAEARHRQMRTILLR